MNDKKNIDRLFQEKFKDFEVAPNDVVWDRISDSLPNKKKKRRVIALWWQIGGVAAVIALLLTVGVSVFNSDENNQNQDLPVVNTDKTDTENKQNEDVTDTTTDSKKDELKNSTDNALELVASEKESTIENHKSNAPQKKVNSNPLTSPVKSQLNTIVNNTNKEEKTSTSTKFNTLKTIPNKEKRTKLASNTEKKSSEQIKGTQLSSESELKSVIDKTKKNNTTATVDNSTSKETESEIDEIQGANENSTNTDDPTLINDPIKESIQDAVAENTKTIDEEEKEDEQNRWNVSPNVAPVYYSSLGQGSSIDQQFNDNAKSSAINMSYGITGAYAISKKLKVRAGINRVNLSQKTSDVFAFTGPEILARGDIEAQPSGNITFNNKVQNVVLMSSEMLNISSAPEAFNTKFAGDIDQRFGFIEVPLELEYRLLDKKFGVNVIGGFSTFFLNQNEIYADIDGTSTLIGEANNINDTSFSANFGLGLDYSLSKQWNINLEPQFKYQINTFNNTTGDFRPFFIGVYTGLSFKF